MDEGVERARNEEERTNDIITEVMEDLPLDFFEIKGQGSVARGYMAFKLGYLIRKIIKCEYEEVANVDYAKDYECWRSDYASGIKCVPWANQDSDTGGFTTIEQAQFITRRDFIMYIAYNAIYLGYPGGMIYKRLVEDILNKLGIEYSLGDCKNETEALKKYISKTNLQRMDFIKSILAERATHEGVSDKNENKGERIFESIPLFEKESFEFEFLIRKRNRSSNDSLTRNKFLSELELAINKRLKPIMSAEELGNITFHKREYSKLVKKTIARMSEPELRQYLYYMRLKGKYIDFYADRDFRIVERLRLEAELRIIYLRYNEYHAFFIRAGRALAEIILSNQAKENGMDLWRALLELVNITGVNYDGDTLLKSVRIRSYQELWKWIRIYDASQARIDIGKKYTDNLLSNDIGMKDFIELCMLGKYIVPGEEDVNQLETAFKHIFLFLEACKRKTENAKINQLDCIDIKKEQSELEKSLESIHINIDIEDFESKYDLNKYRIYFKRCVSTRYVRLFEMIRKKDGNPEYIVQQYIKSILRKYTDTDLDTSKKEDVLKEYTAPLNEYLYSQLIKCLYPNKLFGTDLEEAYACKKRILVIAEKYGFKSALGF